METDAYVAGKDRVDAEVAAGFLKLVQHGQYHFLLKVKLVQDLLDLQRNVETFLKLDHFLPVLTNGVVLGQFLLMLEFLNDFL